MKAFGALALLLSVAVAAQAANYTTGYYADVSGSYVVPNRTCTNTKGWIKAYWYEDEMVLNGTVMLKNIDRFTMAHLHLGNSSSNGDVLAWIWPMDSLMPTSQPLTAKKLMFNFSFTGTSDESSDEGSESSMPADLTPLAGNLTQLKEYMDMNMVYFNVHTVQYPDGVARGNVRMYNSSNSDDNDHGDDDEDDNNDDDNDNCDDNDNNDNDNNDNDNDNNDNDNNDNDNNDNDNNDNNDNDNGNDNDNNDNDNDNNNDGNDNNDNNDNNDDGDDRKRRMGRRALSMHKLHM